MVLRDEIDNRKRYSQYSRRHPAEEQLRVPLPRIDRDAAVDVKLSD